MRHLNEEELIDLAEGAQTESSAAAHVASCESCRRQLADLRAMIAAATDVDVPEPSPLFWDHLSARVREAVANGESSASNSWAARVMSWRLLLPVGALAAVALAAVIALGTGGPQPVSTGGSTPVVAEAATGSGAAVAEDPSLNLIADLASDLDWDAAAEAGLTAVGGTVDRAVLELTPEERVELRRLLKEELSKS